MPTEVEKNCDMERRFQKKRDHELRKSEKRRMKNELREIRGRNHIISNRKKKCTSTKIFMYFILFNCSAVEIYSMVIMYMLKDLSALYSLIGAVVGESISYAIYCAKSFNDSKEEAKSQLERDKFQAEIDANSEPNPDECLDADSEGELTDNGSL